ncbi:MAG TPA: hypothetical protein PJ988_15340 [Anaerolinea sp.]|nr:hypothetical protein [Anaerolinea sp.]
MTERRSNELWVAFLIIGFITVIYLMVVMLEGSIPAAREFFGHSLGVLGFFLMILTETLYTLRKRRGRVSWGPMASWLKFHIITGLVGPYLVLLHSAWKFNGLAGLVMLLTAIVVFSGFIGRYIYTAVPRSADGVEIEQYMLQDQITRAQQDLDRALAGQDTLTRQALLRLAGVNAGTLPGETQVFTRFFTDLKFRLDWNARQTMLKKLDITQVNQLRRMVERRRTLDRQMASLAAVRHLLSIWHTVHIPIGLTLFLSAVVHIFAAIYYATLLH